MMARLHYWMLKMKHEWILVSQPKDEWVVEGIYKTEEAAKLALEKYIMPIQLADGRTHIREAHIEKWDVEYYG